MKRQQLRRKSAGGTRPKHTFSGVSTLSRDAVYVPSGADAEEPLQGSSNPEVVPQAEPRTHAHAPIGCVSGGTRRSPLPPPH